MNKMIPDSLGFQVNKCQFYYPEVGPRSTGLQCERRSESQLEVQKSPKKCKKSYISIDSECSETFRKPDPSTRFFFPDLGEKLAKSALKPSHFWSIL